MHAGNVASACLNMLCAKRADGEFILRIEDIDHTRCRPHYTEAILADLAWLGIAVADHSLVRVQSQHLEAYRQTAHKLADMKILYACQCSRKDYQQHAHYPGFCRDNVIADRAGLEHAIANNCTYSIRVDVAKALSLHNITPALLGGNIAEDYIIIRRDIGTSYHLAVVTDDALQNISHIIRGQDLAALTPFHRLLQNLLGLPVPAYWHHPLLTDGAGQKLSKAAQKQNPTDLRINATPADYWQIAEDWLQILQAENLSDFSF